MSISMREQKKLSDIFEKMMFKVEKLPNLHMFVFYKLVVTLICEQELEGKINQFYLCIYCNNTVHYKYISEYQKQTFKNNPMQDTDIK